MSSSENPMLQKRLECFVKYIAPDPADRDKIKQKADNIRKCIVDKATADGYKVLSSLNSGSFANKTGLRRSLRGNDEVEGQDIDIAFILADKDKNGNKLGCMVPTFRKYLEETWPDSDIGQTKSSATIFYKSDKQSFDTVPLIETDRPKIQKLIRTNGEKRQSSIQQHNEFTKSRNRSSNEIEGVVKFNECVRLIKWWRCFKEAGEDNVFENGIPSFLIILLCAHAYEDSSVSTTYAETLGRWFGCMADVVRNRRTVVFNDFISKHSLPQNQLWSVIDPMDDTNNVVGNWPDYKIDTLASWLEDARDEMSRAIESNYINTSAGDSASLNSLVKVFGNSINNQCKL